MAFIIGQASKQEIDSLKEVVEVAVLTDHQITQLFGEQSKDDVMPNGDVMVMVYVDHDVSAIIGGTDWRAVEAYAAQNATKESTVT